MNIDSKDLLFPSAMIWRETDISDVTVADSVAVIMRTKNRPLLLARAVNSVLNQTHHHWKLYIVNDGGDADAVENVVKPYRAILGERLVVIHHPQSLGVGAAINAALRNVHEAFMVVHDDDDSWHPDFLKETTLFMSQHADAVAVLTNCQIIYETIVDDTVKQTGVEDWWYNSFQYVDINQLIKANVALTMCLLIRTQAARTIGFYNEDLPVLEDWDYNLRLFRIGEIKKLNKTLAYYHHRPASKDKQGYGNSVIAGLDTHLQFQVAYRNALVRAALQSDVGHLGMLHLLMQNNVDRLEWQINQMRDSIDYLCQNTFSFKRLAHKILDFIRKIRGKL